LNTPGNAGKLFISLDQDSAGTNYNELITSRTVNDGRPHHVALVRQGTTARVYIDGVLDISKTTSGVTNITNSASLTTGRSVCTTSTFTGLLDEIEVFNRALSDTEVRSIYNADSAGKCKTVAPPGGQADFVVTGLTVTPPGTPGAPVAAGRQVAVVFNIANQGTGAAGSATHRVRLVVQPLLGGPATDVITPITVETGTLASMTSQSFNRTVTIPATTPFGIARVVVEADFENAVMNEASETNNSAEFQFTITPPAPLPGRIVSSRSQNLSVAARHQPHSRSSGAMEAAASAWPPALIGSRDRAILRRRILATE
jgi:hypothetical protein